MSKYIDTGLYDVVVTFKNGCRVNGSCIGDPLVSTPMEPHGIFDKAFLFLNTCVVKPAEREYETGYMTMIRTEDIAMIQAKPLKEQVKKVTE